MLGSLLVIGGIGCEHAERSPLEQKRLDALGPPNDGAERFGSNDFQDNRFLPKSQQRRSNALDKYLKKVKHEQKIKRERREQERRARQGR